MEMQEEFRTDERCLTGLIDELHQIGRVITQRPLTAPERLRLVLLLGMLHERLCEVLTTSVLVGRAVASYVYWAGIAAADAQPVPDGLGGDLVDRLAELLDRTASGPAVASRRQAHGGRCRPARGQLLPAS